MKFDNAKSVPRRMAAEQKKPRKLSLPGLNELLARAIRRISHGTAWY